MMLSDDPLCATVLATAHDLAHDLVRRLAERRVTLSTAESCTGGLIAAIITAIPGASDVLDRGFITYSNAAKEELLGVPASLIVQNGAVSIQVAQAMAVGCLAHSRADLSIAVTGIAGPSGGTPDKPVGTVHLSIAARNGGATHRHDIFSGDRDRIRLLTVVTALEMLLAHPIIV